MKKHHDLGNSYKEKHLIGLQFLRALRLEPLAAERPRDRRMGGWMNGYMDRWTYARTDRQGLA